MRYKIRPYSIAYYACKGKYVIAVLGMLYVAYLAVMQIATVCVANPM